MKMKTLTWFGVRRCRRGLDPAYGSHSCRDEERLNRWALVAADAQNAVRAPVRLLGCWALGVEGWNHFLSGKLEVDFWENVGI